MHPVGRRSIRLKDYDYSSDGAYFVTICTSGRNRFITTARKTILKRELGDLERRFSGVKVDFYVLMENHIHIIFRFHNAGVPLPKVIQTFKSRTTIAIRKHDDRSSKFWQRNYYERVVRNEKELNALREYIRQNPEQERIDFKDASRPTGRASSTPTDHY
jgi:putative transposase